MHEVTSHSHINYTLLRQYRIRLLLLLAGKIFLIILIIISLAAISAFYLANLPRERATRNFTFTQRVKHGGKLAADALWASLTVPQDNPAASQLPIIQLYVSGSGIDKLNSDLPESGRIYQNGYVRISNKSYKAKIRYRGDSINHWAFPQKSWRVRLKKGKKYEGIRTFNLYLPRTRSQLADYLGYWMGAEMGLLTPRAFSTHVRVNRTFAGMRLFIEQVDRDFIVRNGLPEGKIYIGDINTSAVYGGKRRSMLFEDPHGWEVESTGGSPTTAGTELREITELIDILHEGKSNPAAIRAKLPRILDIEAVLKHMALLTVVGSIHIDNTHNQKFFYNDARKKFSPIVWDITAYLWGARRSLDIASNTLFEKILEIPEFRELKNRYVWEALHKSFSTAHLEKIVLNELDRARMEIEASPHKLVAERKEVRILLNNEWRLGVEDLIHTIRERNEYLEKLLSAPAAFYRVQEKERGLDIDIRVDSHSSLDIQRIKLTTDGKGKLDNCSLRVLSEPPTPPLPSLKGTTMSATEVAFLPAHRLYSLRLFSERPTPIPGYFRYRIECRGSTLHSNQITIEGINSVTHAPYVPLIDVSKFLSIKDVSMPLTCDNLFQSDFVKNSLLIERGISYN